jgi:hypothetical protein
MNGEYFRNKVNKEEQRQKTRLEKNSNEQNIEIRKEPNEQEMKILDEISDFFNKKDSAINLLKNHFISGKIWTSGGRIIDLNDFYERHKNAFERRIQNRIPHDIKILERELEHSRRIPSSKKRMRF